MKFDLISRAKFFFQKRITPINQLKFDLKSMRYGYRQLKHADDPAIDMHKKQHIHTYLNIQCGMDCYFCQNAFYVDKLPKYDKKSAEEWASWLNRMYNFHHISPGTVSGIVAVRLEMTSLDDAPPGFRCTV